MHRRDPGARIGPLSSIDVIGRGAATGALAATLVCGAIAAENIHSGSRLIDWVIGLALVGVPIAVASLLLRIVTGAPSVVLGWVGRHARRPHSVIRPVRASLGLIGRPWVATLVVIIVMVWGSPTDGAIALYHGLSYFEILIATATGVGAAVGLSVAIRAMGDGPRRRRVATALLAGAATVAIATTGWAVTPGPGDPILHEDPAILAKIPLLDVPDPSQRGPFTVVATSYGSGRDRRRDAFGAGAAWTTPTVDASAAIPLRGDIPGLYADWFWGFGRADLPLNALLWYPEDAPGRRPVVLIVHGNHAAADYSDPGYAYLGEHLASRGYLVASIDENYLNGDAFFDYRGDEIALRAWLLLRHLQLLGVWDASPGHPLHGRADLDQIALIGHSRGGEAAVLATMMARDPALTPPGLPSLSTGTVRAVIAIAPADGMYAGPGAPLRPADIDYLVIQGAHDGDLPGVDRITRIDPTLRDGMSQGDRATALTWSGAAAYEVDLDATLASRLQRGSSLVLSIAPWLEGTGSVDAILEVESASGGTASVRLSDLSPARPLLPSRLWKIDGIGDRYLPTERQILGAERFMQTHEIRLDALLTAIPDGDLTTLRHVRLRFDRPGSVLVDDIAFEPPIG
jgi:predicted dienelactone hydrolase